MKKKNKGFTLIELLTVIAILAVILLIAAPTILGVLDKARKNTFKNQVLLYVESMKTQIALKQMGMGYADVTTSELDCSVDSDNVETCTIMVKDVPMESHTLTDGLITITVNNGIATYELSNVTDGTYEYSGSDREIDAKNIEKKEYKSYSIGDSVTLLDGTTWYVIEDSNSSRNTVTLFASKNIKNDASGWTTSKDEYKIFFSKDSNIYAANGTTVTEDSNIKKFIDGSVKTYINNSLVNVGGIKLQSIRLLTTKEMCNIIDSADSSNNCDPTKAGVLPTMYKNVPSWLYSAYYWLMTSSEVNVYNIAVGNFGVLNASFGADDVHYRGARPVIVVSKNNIK